MQIITESRNTYENYIIQSIIGECSSVGIVNQHHNDESISDQASSGCETPPDPAGVVKQRTSHKKTQCK